MLGSRDLLCAVDIVFIVQLIYVLVDGHDGALPHKPGGTWKSMFATDAHLTPELTCHLLLSFPALVIFINFILLQ